MPKSIYPTINCSTIYFVKMFSIFFFTIIFIFPFANVPQPLHFLSLKIEVKTFQFFARNLVAVLGVNIMTRGDHFLGQVHCRIKFRLVSLSHFKLILLTDPENLSFSIYFFLPTKNKFQQNDVLQLRHIFFFSDSQGALRN